MNHEGEAIINRVVIRMRKQIRFFLIISAYLCFMFSVSERADAAQVKINGIDVSRWQGAVDWAKVKNDGVQFVMLGLGRYEKGVQTPDTRFEYNIKEAIANDIQVGVYLYSKALTTEEAEEEANYVLNQIDGYKISYPVAFDIEDSTQMKLSTKERTDIALAFMSVIEKAGYYPMIYASESWLTLCRFEDN